MHNAITTMKQPESAFYSEPVMRPVSNQDVMRESLQSLIRDSYKKVFNAQLNTFLPNLVASTTMDDQITAAFGYSDASQDTLFLESYLDNPIEAVMTDRIGRNIKREHIAEVGNLAVTNMADSVNCMRDIASYLQSLGFEWIVCTATRYLRLLFLNSGAKPMTIAQATISKVANSNTDWGSYYATAPAILIGNIDQSIALIEQKLMERKKPRNQPSKLIKFSGSTA